MHKQIETKAVLTRYIPFVKLISMLEQGLFIPKANLFSDKWEGSLHLFNGENDSFDSLDKLQIAKEWVYISCWYLHEKESHAMWGNYGQSNDSLAIQTTNFQFKSAYDSSNLEPMCCYFDKVRYQQPSNAYELYDGKEIYPWFSNNNNFSVNDVISHLTYKLYHKHEAFSFENEARLVLIDNAATMKNKNEDIGIYLSVKQSRKMITGIILHPDSSSWFEDTVRKLINDTYKLDIPICKSSLIGHKS
ncbi:DUF2971 domain-containing protein [Psychrobacter sp. K31L]|uniref:DUF2971 domain-containing protein n=1 Tax=Psychrobacter sp. K31L TaxID=2820758 RepID=UPI001B3243CA|nr:DUF2971 domain-containing protein [Psychrobacter sp. K31L]MBP3946656.1 DUF2971 domain-containing protein [Psychrobacter sp. K31L]